MAALISDRRTLVLVENGWWVGRRPLLAALRNSDIGKPNSFAARGRVKNGSLEPVCVLAVMKNSPFGFRYEASLKPE